jgi:hypothetical protein
MGGSIHIHGTGSSIVDTVFVCRAHGRTRRGQLFKTQDELVQIVRRELDELRTAGLKPTAGDIRCIVYGHLTRIAVWRLREDWNASLSITERLKHFSSAVAAFGDNQIVIRALVNLVQPIAARTDDMLPLFS